MTKKSKYGKSLKRAKDRVRKWQDHHTSPTNVKLNKMESDAVLRDLCPWCEFDGKCPEILRDGTTFQYCKVKSWDLQVTWVRVSEDRSRVSIGQKYGRLTVRNRRLYVAKQFIVREPKVVWWVCQCDCGNYVTQRGYNLLSGQVKSCGCMKRGRPKNTNLEARYTMKRIRKKSSLQRLAKVAMGHSSRIGQQIDVRTKFNKQVCYVPARCRCGGIIRYDSGNTKVCELCGSFMEGQYFLEDFVSRIFDDPADSPTHDSLVEMFYARQVPKFTEHSDDMDGLLRRREMRNRKL
jgi:hypothetical protein